MRAGFLAIVSSCILAAGFPAQGEDQPMSGAAKAQAIKELFRDRQPVDLVAFVTEDGTDLYRPPEWVAWCEQFLADFREQRGIDHIEPVARSLRYDDPVFRPWQDRCPVLAFNVRSSSLPIVSARGKRADWLGSLPPHMPDGSPFLDYEYGTRDFQLFEGDFDNDDDDNGDTEVIFFSDAFYSCWDLIAQGERFPLAPPPLDRSWNTILPPQDVPPSVPRLADAEYRILDLDRCQSKTLAYVESNYDRQGHAVQGYVNGLIKYRGLYQIFSLFTGENEKGGWIQLNAHVIRPQREPTRGHPVDNGGPPFCAFVPR